jgi:hypothetical protein
MQTDTYDSFGVNTKNSFNTPPLRSISATARDYLAEMMYLDSPNDSCGYDSAKSIVLYFLSEKLKQEMQ